jgi:uncharacterized protein YndB with AHSA1/START domain
MSTKAVGTSVSASIAVHAPPERAFRVFTAEMGTWWPAAHHIIEAEFDRLVFEARPGGRVYDIGVDGSECTWGRVLAYEPPELVVFSWDISPEWKLETDPERASEIEVRFTPQPDGGTLVELEHRNLDRHGDGWEAVRDMLSTPEAWQGTLGAFADAL